MPLIIRRINSRAKWYKEQKDHPWLGRGELLGDVFDDLKTSGGSLSVYLIENDNNSNIDRVAAAIAATRQYPDKWDYFIVDAQIFTENGITMVEEPGDTPDPEVNTWHRDIIELSARKLFNLVEIVFQQIIQETGKTGRVSEKDIKTLLLEGVSSNQLDVAKMNQDLRNRLGV